MGGVKVSLCCICSSSLKEDKLLIVFWGESFHHHLCLCLCLCSYKPGGCLLLLSRFSKLRNAPPQFVLVVCTTYHTYIQNLPQTPQPKIFMEMEPSFVGFHIAICATRLLPTPTFVSYEMFSPSAYWCHYISNILSIYLY